MILLMHVKNIISKQHAKNIIELRKNTRQKCSCILKIISILHWKDNPIDIDVSNKSSFYIYLLMILIFLFFSSK